MAQQEGSTVLFVSSSSRGPESLNPTPSNLSPGLCQSVTVREPLASLWLGLEGEAHHAAAGPSRHFTGDPKPEALNPTL